MQLKKLYRLHRCLSIFIGIPMLLWAVSGLMHPLMTSVRPHIATQASPSTPIPVSLIQKAIPVKQLLLKVEINKTTGIRIIQLDSIWYYQVLQTVNGQNNKQTDVRYFNLQTGVELKNGDQHYAVFLARHFLSAQPADHSPAVLSVREIKNFTDEYSYVNRLLPVWQVQFAREDQIGIYVDTRSGSFAFAIDNNRRNFNRFFGWFHTWSWMDRMAVLKAVIIGLILLLALTTAGLGIYLSFKTKAAKATKNKLVRARKLHRVTAIFGAVFFLSWAFSGLVHAVQNARTPFYIQAIGDPVMKTAALPDNLNDLINQQFLSGPLTFLRLFSINGQFLIKTNRTQPGSAAKDLMVARSVSPGANQFFRIYCSKNALHTGILEAVPEKQIASDLAGRIFWQNKESAISPDTSTFNLDYLTHFTEQYNFSDKILPVWQISKKSAGSNPVFIDVNTCSLVKKADHFKQTDALIFAFFHKHEFMSWAGKSAKDASTIIGVLMLISVIVIGYRLFFIRQKRSKN
ncbi:PepSY-associated TM region [Arachidicoccus rhizosphaerae]|uniref:PepSY-associated TM region n=1 Tax=Arachidicoccus rhizosphaerae TaxID=551991 RepID=A0A1H4CZN8_9BACT|nr:PepSY domain-containing protein [Arachidicoccus rhizosphaerae]SEA65827.1 PepSY-associated TM region [Arachidicoccus rhizosphaerae]